jgi:hypothetical protein
VASGPPSPRRVFLHIGLPKTGTTFLQGLQWSHRDALKDAGLLLPGRGHRRHLLASLELREDPKLARRPGNVAAPWGELVEEANAWPGDVLISHEFFAAASPDQAARAAAAFPDAEVHIVITARAMVDLGISRWQEWVRNGGRRDIDHFPPAIGYDPGDEWGWASFDLADVLERWATAFPPERIHVLPMSSSSDPRDLWLRFAGLLGLDPDLFDTAPLEMNRSLGVVETELLRRVNAELDGFGSAPDRGRWIRGFLAGPDIMASSGERFRPGDQTLAELERRGERAVEVLRAGGYDVVGDIALLEPTDVSGRRHPAEVSDTELLDASLRVVAALMGKVKALSEERDAIRRERDALHDERDSAVASQPDAPPRDRVRDRFRTHVSRIVTRIRSMRA